ncbi:DNA phosphorothioation-dependent restriction protein DptG [Oceanirhabdus seepicola]|uniref:DNA phosphorothioation-dependent restriction protein DptG n=1 Tax=Oceanirhabdus seepicola TaxID=2828781 RepID=A0A9J6NWE3_9CLOT|nr:DNA phosphorothioation-dependent restriction protein DptG [Oceanirhabdus seepicola]MCM1988834.1 DNA phosphorothioation-dependent restriction protein DptG [Oceanirhabdus seepicola]
MMYKIDLKDVRNSYKFVEAEDNTKKINSLQHNTGNKISILPYTTQYKARFKDQIINFKNCIGQFSRGISNKKEIKEAINDEFTDKIIAKIEIDEKDKSVFKNIIKELFFDKEDNLVFFHPKVMNYIQAKNSNKKLGKFLCDVLCKEYSETEELIKKAYDTIPDNIMLKLIVESLPDSNESKSRKVTYENLVPYVSDVFMDDLKYMLKKPSFYNNNIEKLLKFYYMFYVIQLSLNLNKMFDATIEKPIEVYFNLDWEKASKARLSYESGWKLVDGSLQTLFSHANCLELINHNNREEVCSYLDIKNIVNNMKIEGYEESKKSFQELLDNYKNYVGDVDFSRMNFERKYDDDILNIIYELYKSINYQFINSGRKERQKDYCTWFVEFCKVNFLRQRGRLGYTLNLTEEYIIFLTKISLKDNEKMKLKDLFIEYEKRGVFLDRDSKAKISQLFEKLNILEKKSDSGDAQYVKSVL